MSTLNMHLFEKKHMKTTNCVIPLPCCHFPITFPSLTCKYFMQFSLSVSAGSFKASFTVWICLCVLWNTCWSSHIFPKDLWTFIIGFENASQARVQFFLEICGQNWVPNWSQSMHKYIFQVDWSELGFCESSTLPSLSTNAFPTQIK